MRNQPARSAAVAAVTLAAGIILPGPSAQQAASGSAIVEFRALAQNGEPVLDLKPGDVTLRVGGKAREIRSLTVIKAGGGTAPPSTAPAPFVTNTAAAGGGTTREIMLVLDEDSMAPGREQTVRKAITDLVAALTPSDRVGIVSTRQGGLTLQLTNNHDDVRAALAKFAGYAATRESASDFVCRTVIALQTLRNAMTAFSPDASRTVVVVSAALSGPRDEQTVKVGSSSDLCQLRTRDYEDLGIAALNHRVNVYAAHALEAGASTVSSQTAQAGIENVAGVTGGDTIRITGASEAPLVRVARETSAYYAAAFDPEAGERNGQRHRVELRVSRDRVKVSARPSVVIGPAAGASAGKPVTPRDMLRVAAKYHDLPLRAAGFQARTPRGDPQVLVVFQPAQNATKLKAAVVGLYDQKGTLKAQWTATPQDLARSPVMAALVADPAAYRMRVAATDAADRAGTVDTDVEIGLKTIGPVQVSGLLLGVPDRDAPLAPRLQFGANDTQVVSYLEVYGAAKNANVGVTLELAESLDGPSGGGGSVPLVNGPSDDVKIARAGFGIGAMPPGDIVVRAVVTLDGKPLGFVYRTLRKVP